MDRMLCGYRDDPRQWEEPENMEYFRAVESYADELMSDCRVFANAEAVNDDNDLYDGDLLPKLIVEIAKWDGSSLNAAVQMKAMFNLLADEFQKIATREFER
jgi:hypothetical protein